MQKGPVPEGRSIGSMVPLGRDYFPDDSRHFVPGYDRAVPPGQAVSGFGAETGLISTALSRANQSRATQRRVLGGSAV
jgi:hypothetical protein